MKLLTEKLRERLPRLDSQQNEANAMVYAKFFTPDANFTWWVVEGSAEGDDFRFFGFVRGHEDEWGYFLLSELTSVQGPMGLSVERDLTFEPGPFTDVVPARDA